MKGRFKSIVDLYDIKTALSYYISHVVGGSDREKEYEKSYEKICLIIEDKERSFKNE